MAAFARCLLVLALKIFAAVSLIAAADLSALKWQKRVLLVAAPDEGDRALQDQRRIVARWREGATERDLVIVEVVGNSVTGTGESAATLRRRYTVPSGGFSVVLIGKDGGVKLRGTHAVTAATLEETIDAMPMRRSER